MAKNGTQNTLEKFNALMAEGEGKYYEAHQMCRTLARRYIKQDKHTKAIRLLYDSSLSMFEHDAQGSGADLANYLIDTYTVAKLPVNDESLDRVYKLILSFPAEGKGAKEEKDRKKFISRALDWTIKQGEYVKGEPKLHDFVGRLLYKEGQMRSAEEHLLLGNDESATLLGNIASETKEEDGISRTVIRVLLEKNFRHTEQKIDLAKNVHRASLAFDSFEKSSKTGKATAKARRTPGGDVVDILVYDQPLSNFAQLLLLTVQREAKDLFIELKEKYQYALKYLIDDLQEVGSVYFGIEKPRQPGNMLADLMSSLFQPPPANNNRIQSPPPQLD